MSAKGDINGIVIEALADVRFRVRLDDGQEVICYLAGRMRYRNINVNVGDKVEVLLDPMGGKATNRITWRK